MPEAAASEVVARRGGGAPELARPQAMATRAAAWAGECAWARERSCVCALGPDLNGAGRCCETETSWVPLSGPGSAPGARQASSGRFWAPLLLSAWELLSGGSREPVV